MLLLRKNGQMCNSFGHKIHVLIYHYCCIKYFNKIQHSKTQYLKGNLMQSFGKTNLKFNNKPRQQVTNLSFSLPYTGAEICLFDRQTDPPQPASVNQSGCRHELVKQWRALMKILLHEHIAHGRAASFASDAMVCYTSRSLCFNFQY